MILDDSGVEVALSALGEHLAYSSSEPIELVICGGAALQALGLIKRTTRDVDVLALLRESTDGHRALSSAEPLPDLVVEAAAIVARDLSLPSDWLNSGPTDLLTHGLPEGLLGRLHSRGYGRNLTVHFIDRFDQICLKAYAAMNGGSAHHLSDLKQLAPAEEEMLSAAQWCLTQDASDVFPLIVTTFLDKVGYRNVAQRLGTENQE